MELGKLIAPELKELLADEPSAVRELATEFHPQDVADSLLEIDSAAVARALLSFPLEYSAQVFERLEEEKQVAVARELGVDSTVNIVSEMDADEVVGFFRLLPEPIVSKLLGRLAKVDPVTAAEVQELTQYGEYTAGGMMTSEFVEVPVGATVDETLNELRRNAALGLEVLDVVFVVDRGQKVAGYVPLRKLLMSQAGAPISEVMQHDLVSVPPEMDQEEVARTMARYDLNALPVVDQNGVMLGLITADDVIDVAMEEADEDAQRMGALEPIEESYLNVSFWTYFRKRAPWLMVLFVGGFFTTTAMEVFSPILTSMTQLAFYVPLLISAGGNSGSQSATMIIRGLAVGNIDHGDALKVMRREVAQGLLLGLGLGMVGVIRALIGNDGGEMAALVGVTIVSIVTIGCTVGAVLPLILSRFGVDPATSSTPFIATLVDVLGIVVYLSLARLMLSGLAEIPVFG